jgi:hypothetical protein
MTTQPLNRVWLPAPAPPPDVMCCSPGTARSSRVDGLCRTAAPGVERASDQQVPGSPRGAATAPSTPLRWPGATPVSGEGAGRRRRLGFNRSSHEACDHDPAKTSGHPQNFVLPDWLSSPVQIDEDGRGAKRTGSTLRASAATARPPRRSSRAEDRHAVANVWIAPRVADNWSPSTRAQSRFRAVLDGLAVRPTSRPSTMPWSTSTRPVDPSFLSPVGVPSA